MSLSKTIVPFLCGFSILLLSISLDFLFWHNIENERFAKQSQLHTENLIEDPDTGVYRIDGSRFPFIAFKLITRKGNIVVMAKVNTNYCKPSEDEQSLIYAPVTLPPKLGAPTEEDYYAKGWYRNEVEPPNPPEGKMVDTVRYYVSEDNVVVAEYTYIDMPPPVRTFSKLKLYGALTEAGLWEPFVQWLETHYVNGINAYTAFTLAQDLSDAHPLFAQWIEQLKTDLGISDEIVEAILEASIAE